MAALVRRSITELCRAEYRGDPRVLADWLASTTAGDFARWMSRDDRSVCVAVGPDGRIAAVGMVAWRGEIVLNYVAPEARFLGAGKALMAHMEDRLRARGVAEATLLSTQVAERFYRARGYAAVAQIASRFGTLAPIRMAKRLE